MDDLTFRRALMSSPDELDEALRKAIAEQPDKKQLWQEHQRLNEKLRKAVCVSAPDGMRARLMLRQTMQQRHRSRRRQYWAVAASVALVSLFSLTYLLPGNVNLGDHALAHVYHEGTAPFLIDEQVGLSQVNAKLAQFSGQFTGDIGKVYYANLCDFDRIKSLHMIIDGPDGKVSVFVVPHQAQQQVPAYFHDALYTGESKNLGHASVVVVGKSAAAVEQALQRVSNQLQFSA